MRSNVINHLLEGKYDNHIFPFLWIHGEPEKVLREYVKAIDEAHIKAFCVESRPHPEFVKAGWWRDMDILIDEAKKRNMKMWILDDSHFPTGFCNGEIEKAHPSLRRLSIVPTIYKANPKGRRISFNKFLKEKKTKAKGNVLADEIIGVFAISPDKKEMPLDLTELCTSNGLSWKAPSEAYRVMAVKKSANYGAHPSYMNMMCPASCKVLIDTVYETHFEHYKDEFGKTIEGFFSDEPELGNGKLYRQVQLGTDTDLPWAEELIPRLKDALGREWRCCLPYLWLDDLDRDLTAKMRAAFMNAVTECVRIAFSEQIGDWCRRHGVRYIGHVIEDNNQHHLTGTSLGHYFRGLRGQDMAGIDDIGGQVMPQCEDGPDKAMLILPRDGVFYHFMLGKLAQSMQAVDPRKRGNSMCEIFGNYGWQEGFRLETYLADHFLVNGINHYVPHAFSAKAYPDHDCPPHFYAHGRNPQYRHMYALMDYMNRVSCLISGGEQVCRVAVLYNAEGVWSGRHMLEQNVARVLTESQIDFNLIPLDVFTDMEYYQTNLRDGFSINGHSYEMLIIPYAEYVSRDLAGFAGQLNRHNIPVAFIEHYPLGIYDLDDAAQCREVLNTLKGMSETVPLGQLADYVRKKNLTDISISPACRQIKTLHYRQNETDIYMLVNEGTSIYRGRLHTGKTGDFYRYDAWTNTAEKVRAEGQGEICMQIEPLKSFLIIREDELSQQTAQKLKPAYEEIKNTSKKITVLDKGWKRSVCKSIDYPVFSSSKEVGLPDCVSDEKKHFSGYIAYENSCTLHSERILLEITDAYEGVELFINGRSAGVQVVPPYRFDISELAADGENNIRIEVSTTLERERRASLNQGLLELINRQKKMSPTGLTGKVFLLEY